MEHYKLLSTIAAIIAPITASNASHFSNIVATSLSFHRAKGFNSYSPLPERDRRPYIAWRAHCHSARISHRISRNDAARACGPLVIGAPAVDHGDLANFRQVRFALRSGHARRAWSCPLRANSGRSSIERSQARQTFTKSVRRQDLSKNGSVGP
jgi:hypothetical protein